jgi:hypothetical protein
MTMVLRDHSSALAVGLLSLGLAAGAAAGESASSIAVMAPLTIPHTLNLELDYRAQRRARSEGHVERLGASDFSPGLRPLTWPRNGDVRARLMTTDLRQAPLLGWVAANLYRSRKETGWCLEMDPGEGEYIVFYRRHL